MTESKDITRTENKDIEKTRELKTANPSVDIYENDNEILLYADMPGVHKDDVTVNIENGKLSISGVRRLGHDGVSNWAELGAALLRHALQQLFTIHNIPHFISSDYLISLR